MANSAGSCKVAGVSTNLRLALALLIATACNTTPSSEAPTSGSASPAVPSSKVVPSGPAASALSSPTSAARAFHYDLVLHTTDGKTTARAAFSVDLSDTTLGSVSFAKNVSFVGGSRADVGTKVKCRLTMQGDVPQLDVEAETSVLDATGKIRKASSHGTTPTPVGTATVLLESSDGGMQFKLSATPTASAPLEPKATEAPGAAYVVDVSIAHTGDGAAAAPTTLTLNLSGDAPAIAKAGANVALVVGDAGVSSARQDVGSRMKATGHARGTSLDLDFDFESSAIESATPSARIRKMTAHGALVAPFDKPTTAFTGEEDGHRYTVTVTPHRAK